MSGRTILADALTGALPGWLVLSTARQLDGVPKAGACVLWTSKRARLDLNGFEYIQDTVDLWVLTATERADLIEDDLDAQLLAVLEVLEASPAFTWTSADRGVLADKFQGWRIEVTCANHINTEE